MKAVILAGGRGTRMGDKTAECPKPMIEVAGRPLLWHLMNLCSMHGISEFIIALGYRGSQIKDYFCRYGILNNDVSVDLGSGQVQFLTNNAPNWRVHLIDTGPATMTGGRLKRLAYWLRTESHFLMTYGDGLADINLKALEEFHIGHGRLATITAVQVPERFGRLTLKDDEVTVFREKSDDDRPWINGGFFVLNPKVLHYIEDDSSVWEKEPLRRLCIDHELRAFRHKGFWCGADTPADLDYLESVLSKSTMG
jgi:glucose-1-phosphate cytidylyltransferase